MTMTSSSVSLRYRSALGQLLRHRRSWIRARLVSLAGLFGVAVAAFDVLSNHLHVILRIRPDVVALWFDQEVARRWLALFPGRVRSQTASAVAAPGRLSRASGQQFPACGFRPENTLVLISHFANSLRTMLSRIPYLTAWANGVTRHGTCFR